MDTTEQEQTRIVAVMSPIVAATLAGGQPIAATSPAPPDSAPEIDMDPPSDDMDAVRELLENSGRLPSGATVLDAVADLIARDKAAAYAAERQASDTKFDGDDAVQSLVTAGYLKKGDPIAPAIKSLVYELREARAKVVTLEAWRAGSQADGGPVTGMAAVSLVERDVDGKLLVVWNRRYGGWTLPGGKVEPNESLGEAQARELAEETGLKTVEAAVLFDGPHGLAQGADRATHVTVFRVRTEGEAAEQEHGCPIEWMSRADFVTKSPFGAFYGKLFEEVPAWSPA